MSTLDMSYLVKIDSGIPANWYFDWYEFSKRFWGKFEHLYKCTLALAQKHVWFYIIQSCHFIMDMYNEKLRILESACSLIF